ncbi:Uncharacterised protein [Mycoplasmopsis citelli]|uniref:Uncharacterized protein n=1 Tax=Mycoplasmopsis citelli TaxID=171281 RepID=A0A449B2A0_9BACT|nr:hypothetical protein [Mycoplasmopsis citelli]VEU74654.1 Uncharacterised protein [Mycoplasmopsis citelli]
MQDLQDPGNDLTKQIDFVKQYTDRISNLSSETLKLQNQILKKAENQNKKSRENIIKFEKQKNNSSEEIKRLNETLKKNKRYQWLLRT